MARTFKPDTRGLETTLDWDVNKLDISNEHGKIEDYCSIVRNDSNETLSVMKKSYRPLLNSEFKPIVNDLIEISGFPNEGFLEYRNGSSVLCFLKNTKGLFHIGQHEIQDYFIVGNSFDGSKSFFIGTTTIFLRCSNQFSRISNIAKVRHSKNSGEKIDELKSYLSLFFEERKNIFKTFEDMSKIEVTKNNIDDLCDKIIGVSEKEKKDRSLISTRRNNMLLQLRESVNQETKELGSNLWGVFNGATHYTTHVMTTEKSFGNVFGNASRVNDKAFKACIEHSFLKNKEQLVLS